MANSEEIKKQVKETERLTEVQRLNLDLNRDINDVIREGLKDLKGQLDAKQSIRRALNEINKASELQVDFAKQGTKALLDSKKLNDTLAKSKISQNKLQLNSENLLSKARKLRADAEANIDSLTVDQLKSMEEQAKVAEKVAGDLLEQKVNLEAGEESLKSMAIASTQIANLKSSKAFDFLSNVAGAIPGVKSLTGGFDAAAAASKEAAASMVKINEDGIASSLTGLDKFKAGVKGLTAGVGELMKSFGAIAIFGKLVQGVLKADKSISAFAQGLNTSNKEAKAISGEITKIKSGSDDVVVTYGGLKHTLLDINKELGTSVMINKDTLKTFTTLNKRAGLTEDSLMAMTKLSLATGGNLEDMTGEFLAQAKITSKNQKVALNEKQLFEEISKLSAATTLSLGKNPSELARAVTTAKALGIEMGNLENIAESLLDFESSIEKELEAELLLGKNLNLEKARQAALNNDLATVAEEIAKQAGSAADFANMNRIEQQALADAVGMSREELAKTLFVQEQLGGAVGEEASLRKDQIEKLQKEGLSNDEIKEKLQKTSIEDLKSQASAQAEMAAATERMNETFMELGKNLTPVLNIMAGIAGYASKNVEAIMGAIAAYKVYQGYQKISAALAAKDAAKGLAGYAINAAKSAAAVPVIGPALAIAAGIAAFAAGRSLLKKSDAEAKADDFVQGPMGSSGYGRTLLSPKGSLAINDGDTILAGTNLDQGGNTSATNVDMTETNTLLRRILSKQGTVSLDAEKMGTAISMNTYEISP